MSDNAIAGCLAAVLSYCAVPSRVKTCPCGFVRTTLGSSHVVPDLPVPKTLLTRYLWMHGTGVSVLEKNVLTISKMMRFRDSADGRMVMRTDAPGQARTNLVDGSQHGP